MKTKARTTTPDDYLDLVRRFPLRPIRSAADHVQAVDILADLIGRADAPGLTADESDYADVLGRLVRDYDKQHSSLRQQRKLTPIEALKCLMHEHDMNTIDLGRLVGGSGQASMILRGKRELSKANIRTLADRFKVNAGLFF
jgi:HTH-type transcriptional regulator/antitoxin HigA